MDTIDYLLSLEAVRERATKVYNIAVDGNLNNFDYHEDRMANAADFVASLIMVLSMLILISHTKN